MNVEAVMSYTVFHLSGGTQENHEMRMPYVSASQGGLQRATFHLRNNSDFYGSRFPLSICVQVKQRNV